MSETIALNFRKPMALFPLAGLVLLPHAVQALHIFEPRYRQMIEHALAVIENGNLLTAAPIALASPAPATRGGAEAPAALKPAVCVGKIVQLQRLPDGRYHLLLQGVCRARIRALMEPEGDRLYRMARLEPLERVTEPPPPLPGVRSSLKSMLSGPRLARLSAAPAVLEWIARKDVPTHALLELVGFTLIGDETTRYRLLAEPDPSARAQLIRRELSHLDALVSKADEQAWKSWPKGTSWN
ncbi:MAG: LON peptidase substrate-binding domain-containing protein [Phycisphaerales bacterium]